MSEQRTLDELIEVWRQAMDPGYTRPLETEAEGRGLDIIAGLAATFVRASEAVQLTTQSFYLKEHSTQLDPPASGGVKATGKVELRAETPTDGVILIDASASISPTIRAVSTNPDGDEIGGPVFNIVGPLPINEFPAFSEGPFELDVEADREGFIGNLKAGTRAQIEERLSFTATMQSLTASAGEIEIELVPEGNTFGSNVAGQYVRVLDGVNAGRPAALVFERESALIVRAQPSVVFDNQTGGTVEVINLSDLGISAEFVNGTSGGRNAELDLIGRERNVPRALNETDPQYRDRLSSLRDTVSPNAIRRLLDLILDAAEVEFRFLELGQPDIGGAWFPSDTPPQIGGFFDDPFGYRKNQFFVPVASTTTGIVIGFLVVVNGDDLPPLPEERNALLSRLVESVLEKKGAGVPWAIAFEPPLPVP